MEVGSWKLEVGSCELEVGSCELEVVSWKLVPYLLDSLARTFVRLRKNYALRIPNHFVSLAYRQLTHDWPLFTGLSINSNNHDWYSSQLLRRHGRRREAGRHVQGWTFDPQLREHKSVRGCRGCSQPNTPYREAFKKTPALLSAIQIAFTGLS